MRSVLLNLLLFLATPALAEHVPLGLEEARGLIGEQVLTSDAVPLGRLVATRAHPQGGFHCIVKLDPALEAKISALIVDELIRAPDGSLRLSETAHVLAERMRLPLGNV